jgi:hypothetical protein
MSPPSKDLTKQHSQELTRASSTPLMWRAWGTVGGGLEDSKTGPNTMKAFNQHRQTDLLKSGPTSHVNPFVDIEIKKLVVIQPPASYKRPHTLQAGGVQEHFPLSLSELFDTKNARRRATTS